MRIIAIALLLSAVSCSIVDKTDNEVVLNVNSNSQYELPVTSFVDSVRFVKLQTTPDCVIGDMSDVFAIDSLYIIPDPRSYSVFFFDKEGKYLSKIQKRGRATGEYVKITSVMVDKDKIEIIIYDVSSRKLLYYDFAGNFIREISNFGDGKVLRDIINLPNGHFLCFRHDRASDKDLELSPWRLWELDAEGRFVKGLLKYKDPHPSFMVSPVPYLFSLPDDKIGVMTAEEEDYMYDCLSGNLTRNIMYNLDCKGAKDYSGYKLTEPFALRINTQYKGDYILTEWFNDKNRYFVTLYSKKDDSFVCARNFTLDLALVPGRIVNSDMNDIIVSSVTHTFVADYLKKNAPDQKKAQWYSLVEGMSESDLANMNPILQLLYVKK